MYCKACKKILFYWYLFIVTYNLYLNTQENISKIHRVKFDFSTVENLQFPRVKLGWIRDNTFTVKKCDFPPLKILIKKSITMLKIRFRRCIFSNFHGRNLKIFHVNRLHFGGENRIFPLLKREFSLHKFTYN